MAREDIFELQTKRLRLRPLRLEDRPAVQRFSGSADRRASIGGADAGLHLHALA